MNVYIDPSREAVAAFLKRNVQGPVTMLNLLRFRETADYSAFPQLAPASPISGREAYEAYLRHTRPFLRAAGGEVLFLGTGGDYLIGPPDRGWDLVLLVRHKSVEAFLAFASDEGYRAGAGHRTAALQDSRLLPLIDGTDSMVG